VKEQLLAASFQLRYRRAVVLRAIDEWEQEPKLKQPRCALGVSRLYLARLCDWVIVPRTNAGVDARTTAGLETGATFRPLHNHAVTVLEAKS
jgi:hypothetical protein